MKSLNFIWLFMLLPLRIQESDVPIIDNEHFQEELYRDWLENNTEYLGEYIVTAYNSVREQCDNSPKWTASGFRIRGEEKIVACNFLPFGTRLIINDEIWVVEDRMHPRFSNRIDLHFGGRKHIRKAKNWGKQRLEVRRILSAS